MILLQKVFDCFLMFVLSLIWLVLCKFVLFSALISCFVLSISMGKPLLYKKAGLTNHLRSFCNLATSIHLVASSATLKLFGI